MPILLIIFAELLILFFLSKHLVNVMHSLFFALTHSQRISLTLITTLFLPGTIIHELSHWLIAELVRVRTGEISLTPEIERRNSRETYVKLGHVQVAESDPIRKYLIGFAPLFMGTFFLFLLIWLFQFFWPQINDLKLQIGFVCLIGYLLFSISNNMFSSKKDLEGFIFVVPILVILAVAIYWSGIRIDLTGKSLEVYTQVVGGLMKALAIVIGINIAILAINGLLLRGLFKLRN